MTDHITTIKTAIQDSFDNNTLVKIALGNYKGTEAGLKNIRIKRTIIKRVHQLSFTYKHKTKDIVKNYPLDKALPLLEQLVAVKGFRLITVYTLDADWHLEYYNSGRWVIKKRKPSTNTLPSLAHDRKKKRKIEAADKQYLHELKITDSLGKVYKNAQSKYKQINHYIEILSNLLKKLPQRKMTNVVDMGAGKGYLTFALYDYLNHVLKKQARVTGVEYRKDLVDLCNRIAAKSNFQSLAFVQGTIEDYVPSNELHVLIALHACDTATDDAIAKGIRHQADLIVVAPCCHKQIRREMSQGKSSNELGFLLKHGIFLERQAEMVTDGIRALILEYHGYSTKVFEFVSDAHTPKNVLVVGEKKAAGTTIDKQGILEKIQSVKSFFGIGEHYLEGVLEV